MRNLKYLSVLCLLGILMASCESATEQVGGLVGQVNFQTFACLPKEKMITVRNENTEEPQRVQAVMFELGTNKDKFYKINKVVVNGVEYTGTGQSVNELIIPAGGVMDIYVQYNPKTVTFDREVHVTYLDIIMNGPKLGILQIKLDGRAEMSMPDCGVSTATLFEVLSVTTYMLHDTAFPNNDNKTELDLSTIEGDFGFTLDEGEGKASMTDEDWPTINLPLPPGLKLNSLPINLDVGSYTDGDFDGSNLEIRGLILTASSLAIFNDITLTTGTSSVTTDHADLTLDGSPLDNSGQMTLVVVVPLTKAEFAQLPDENDQSIFAAEIKLKQK